MERTHALVLSHGATRGSYDPDAWLKTVVGDPASGKRGRIIHALWYAQTYLGGFAVRYWIGTGIDERTGDEPASLVNAKSLLLDSKWDSIRARFGLRSFAGARLEDAVIDTQSGNTRQEVENAVAYCVAHGIGTLVVVSTDCHVPRVFADAKLAARGTGIEVIATGAETDFPGLEGAMPVIIDPPHVQNAPFAQVESARQWYKLFPAIFMTFRGDVAKYQDFTLELVNLMRRFGIYKNAAGEKI